MRINRRQFGTVLAGAPLSMALRASPRHVETRVNGVVFGVETFSFHAPAFYERSGYTVFGRLAGFSGGHVCLYLRKDLAAGRGGGSA